MQNKGNHKYYYRNEKRNIFVSMNTYVRIIFILMLKMEKLNVSPNILKILR